MGGFDIFVLVLLLLAVMTLFASVKQVRQGFNWTVERFGKYRKTLGPGLNLIVPFIDRIGRKQSLMETPVDIPAQEVITKDNATVKVDALAFYQIFDASKASYEVQDLSIAIVKLIMTNIRSVMGSMDLDQMLSHRDDINEKLLMVVDQAVKPWGIKVNRIEIKDIVPPQNLMAAMALQMQAEREKRAAILKSEGIKQSQILEAEGAKQAQILQAEGRLGAAQKDAEARERLAKAEAMATTAVSEAVKSGDVSALNYFVATKYLDSFAQLARSPNTKMLILPMEATGVLASLAGIGQLAKAALGDDKDGMSATSGTPGAASRPAYRTSVPPHSPGS
jgi:regulator of protease activity HflC (stomatin/prohibitin superfamily)